MQVSVNLRWRAMTSFSISCLKMRSKPPQVVNFGNKNLKSASDVGFETRVSARDLSRHVCQKPRFGPENKSLDYITVSSAKGQGLHRSYNMENSSSATHWTQQNCFTNEEVIKTET
jgi:hypothetical protein